MPDLPIALIALAVTAAAGYVLLRVFASTRTATSVEDRYLEALEAWVDGRLDDAENRLQEVVRSDTGAVEPYLQLGNLLRRTGRADKAAAMHRALMARGDLSRSQRVKAGLALAEDLLGLGQFASAGQVLDDLVRHVGDRPAYWRARFRQWQGAGDGGEAARALKHAADHVPEPARAVFRNDNACYQLDRAFAAALEGDESLAQRCMKAVPGGHAMARYFPLVKVVLLSGQGHLDKALDTAAADLAGVPDALLAFQDFVRPILLEKNRFERSLPLLERVVQDSAAPVELVVELALLYEKTGRREQALTLLAAKEGRSDLTPDAAAPLLNALIRDGQQTELQRVWHTLHLRRRDRAWRCVACGHAGSRLAWFCPHCFSFGAFVDAQDSREEAHA